MADKPVRLDEIGYWSEVKLDIVKKYAKAYSTIMARQKLIKAHVYVDAFAGAGTHISRSTGQLVAGSPLNAMTIAPPFAEIHLIDLDGGRAKRLRELTKNDPRVRVHQGDCNKVLLQDVFPRCHFRDYRRALCLLDPYRLNVNWEVLETAGRLGSVDVFYNFMIMDGNRNVFWRDSSKITPAAAKRMDAVWPRWRLGAYHTTQDLFGDVHTKASNEDIADAFREDLRNVARFKYVPEPLPMRNSQGAILYYLYLASPKAVAAEIVKDIFDKYRARGAA